MTPREAELYALTHRGNAGDAEFYLRACRGAVSALELGTGYGRLLPHLKRVTPLVVGLDREAALLAVARRALHPSPGGGARAHGIRGQSGLCLVRADMRAFDLRRTFERVLLPYNALFCLLSRRALLSCFKSVRAHLAPGGAFFLDVWCADRFERRAGATEHRDDEGAIVSLFHRGDVWDVYERSRLQRAQQRLDVVYTYVSRGRGTALHSRIQQRYWTSRQITEVLNEAGMRVDARWGDFALRPFRAASPHFILRALAARDSAAAP